MIRNNEIISCEVNFFLETMDAVCERQAAHNHNYRFLPALFNEIAKIGIKLSVARVCARLYCNTVV